MQIPQAQSYIHEVLVARPIGRLYSYQFRAPIAAGTIVRVMFNNREVSGVVWQAPKLAHHRVLPAKAVENKPADGGGLFPSSVVSNTPSKSQKNTPAEKGIKSILAHGEQIVFPALLREYIKTFADYTLNPLGAVLQLFPLDPSVVFPRQKKLACVRLAQPPEEGARLGKKAAILLDLLVADADWHIIATLEEDFGISRATINNCVTRGWAEKETIVFEDAAPATQEHAGFDAPSTDDQFPVLNEQQQRAWDTIDGASGYQCFLLEGVTGSGKTEVYCQFLRQRLLGHPQEQVLGQVLVLLPEIALSTYLAGRIGELCNHPALLWHSELTPKQKNIAWHRIASGDCRVVVGPRSALFLPFAALTAIVVDEEHDGSFKQEDKVIYNARDMANLRARMGELPIILSSATPSLESMHRAKTEQYQHLHIPNRYYGDDDAMPTIELVKGARAQDRLIGPDILEAFAHALKQGEQCLLFLNRRGYAPLYCCKTCGEAVQCRRCISYLVYHRNAATLLCHLCGTKYPLVTTCASCQSDAGFALKGTGVERLEEELIQALELAPERVILASSDTKSQLSAWHKQFENREIDVLIGTQLVVKGYDFGNLSTVGVVDGDMGRSLPDYRGVERLYQLLSQVAGRAGRRSQQGRVLIQSALHTDPTLQALVQGESAQFYDAELAMRAKGGMPPYGRLASIIVRGGNREEVIDFCQRFAQDMPPLASNSGIRVVGPAPAHIQKIAGRWRYRFVIITAPTVYPHRFIKQWTRSARKQTGNVRYSIDIDPYSLL